MTADLLERLQSFRSRGTHQLVGLMSGTSADGIDAALVRLRDEPGDPPRVHCELRGFLTVPYPDDVHAQLVSDAVQSAVAIARLDVRLGGLFAEAALAVMDAAGVAPAAVDAIGSHGQTVCHDPPGGGAPGATLQIARPAVIARRTGCIVVADFRSADMALHGQGAPLVPRVDQLLFASPGERRVLLNLGGIANLCAITGRDDDLVAFDTGPGNALLDALVRIATGGREHCDRDGAGARAGTVQPGLLAELLEHPFLRQPPPRSADRAAFGEALARQVMRDHAGSRVEDLLATAARFTAESVAAAIRSLPAPFAPVDRVIASGGGVHNRALMTHLAECLDPVPLETSDRHGVPADAKEAVAFAVLARETLLGRPGNVPRATGARGRAVLGSITP